jgi:hypothetical protein
LSVEIRPEKADATAGAFDLPSATSTIVAA